MPTRKGSHNIFPLVRLSYEDDTPATPPTGQGHLVAGVDKVLRYIDDDGVVVEIATASGGIPDTIVNAKGDLIAASAADTVDRLAVGTNGQVLTADSGETLGVKWAAPAGGSAEEWDTVTVKGSDQGVTNSATLVDDSELTWAVVNGECWKFQLEILYQSDATGDYKCDLAMSTGNLTAWHRYVGSDTTSNAILVSTGVRDGTAASTTDIAAGGGAAVNRTILIEGIMRAEATATVSFRFAQNTQTVGQTATTKAGSRLLLKKLV